MPKTWQRVPTLPPTTDTTSTIRPRGAEVKHKEGTRESSSSSTQGIELVDFGGRVAQAKSRSSSSRTAVGRWSVDKRLQGIADDEGDEDEEKDKAGFRLPRVGSQSVKAWSEALRLRQQIGKGAGVPKMKFSHSLQFNAVPDWSAYYIAYSNLKKL